MAEQKKKIILFVDDDEDDYLLLRDMFRECREDIDLAWAKDGEDALLRLTSQNGSPKPFLILLDLNMPKLSGHEVLRQIRSQDYLKHIPIVVLTNSINKEEARQAYRMGVNSFIRKPSGYKELREFVTTFSKYWFEYSMLLATE